MRTVDCLRLALAGIRRDVVRAALCGLSAAVGVSLMLLVSAAGSAGRQAVDGYLKQLGVSGLAVSVESGMDTLDLQALTQAVEGVTAAMQVKMKLGSCRVGSTREQVLCCGADAEMNQVFRLTVLAGRTLNEQDVAFSLNRVVIDATLAQKIWQRDNVVGQTLRLTIDGQEDVYEVVGVIAPQTGLVSAFLEGAAPSLIYLPYARVAGAGEQADQIFLSCMVDSGETATRLSWYLQKRLGQEAPQIQDLSGTLETATSLTRAISGIFVLLAGAAFAAALFGVAAGQLQAVRERKGEIGIYLAVGARRWDVLRIFLLESALICLFGGALGVGGGLLLLAALQHCTGLALHAGVQTAALLLLGAGGSGAAAGLLPAFLAARMTPAEAMRGL